MRCIVFIWATMFIFSAALAGTTATHEDALHDDPAAATESSGDSNRRSYEDWDTNGDGRIDKQEFHAGYEASGLFDKWDLNDDGVLNSRELGEGMYATWDFDDDTQFDNAGFPTYWFRE